MPIIILSSNLGENFWWPRRDGRVMSTKVLLSIAEKQRLFHFTFKIFWVKYLSISASNLFCRLCRNIYSCEIFSNSSKYLSLSTRRGPQTVYGSAASCRAFCKPDTCHYAVMNINKHFKKKHWLDFRDTLCKNIFLKPDLGDLVLPPCPLEIDFC